jgi:acyl-CoA oxidase
MTHVRYILIMEARLALARATTIAIRYAAIRRQGRDRDAVLDRWKNGKLQEEIAVIDYDTVRIRIFPLLATSYALHYSGKATARIYLEHRDNVDQRADFSLMSELHLTTSALKSMCTELAADGIEKCRRAMGGHGFGGPSGFINLNNDYLSRPTVEGDNWMITQQVARGLIKLAKETLENNSQRSGATKSLVGQTLKKYLATKDAPAHHGVLKDDNQMVQVFGRRVAYLVCALLRHRSVQIPANDCQKIFKAYEAHEVQKRPWNSLLVQFHQLSRGSYPPRFISTDHHRESS